MTVLLKFLFVFLLLYFGFRMITKPFRDFLKQAKRQAEMNTRGNSESSRPKEETKTENLGEYIDYEEVE